MSQAIEAPSSPVRPLESPSHKPRKQKDLSLTKKRYDITDLTNVNRQFPLNKVADSPPAARRRSIRRT